MQKTLKRPALLTGVGLHSGAPVSVRIVPAAPNSGIVFKRVDIAQGDNEIPALWDRVVDTRLCTAIGNAAGARVATIEHLMAALRGCHIDNARVEIDGPETPVMDGSSAPFVEALLRAGVRDQLVPRRFLRIRRPVAVEDGDKCARLLPGAIPVFRGTIDFSHAAIGRQSCEMALVNGNFAHDLAEARTFGFLHEVEWMRANGLGRGGSMENAIVVGPEGILNPEGLRSPDEFIRHKLLDAVGDLYLAGMPILGEYEGVRAGHALNNALLHQLFANADAWDVITEQDPASPPVRAALASPVAVSAGCAAA